MTSLLLATGRPSQVKFFLGRGDDFEPDVVRLDVPEGYRWNALKGLRFLEWCASHAHADFVVKVDDDVYLRPLPLIYLLHMRPPFGYVWGYFDHFSPVPRDPQR